MGGFRFAKGLSTGVCVCMPVCLVMGAVVESFILYLMIKIRGEDFNFFNVSSARAILFSFVLLTVSQAICYFI